MMGLSDARRLVMRSLPISAPKYIAELSYKSQTNVNGTMSVEHLTASHSLK